MFRAHGGYVASMWTKEGRGGMHAGSSLEACELHGCNWNDESLVQVIPTSRV